MQQTLGYTTLGNGPETVFILHDWFSDQSSYDNFRPYLNTGFYKFVKGKRVGGTNMGSTGNSLIF